MKILHIYRPRYLGEHVPCFRCFILAVVGIVTSIPTSNEKGKGSESSYGLKEISKIVVIAAHPHKNKNFYTNTFNLLGSSRSERPPNRPTFIYNPHWGYILGNYPIMIGSITLRVETDGVGG